MSPVLLVEDMPGEVVNLEPLHDPPDHVVNLALASGIERLFMP